MASSEFSLRVGGAAGDGVASSGEIFAKMCSRSGLHVNAYNSYQSVIRGGHVWFQIRAGAAPMLSPGDRTDLVIALNQETVDVHARFIRRGGGVICDPAKVVAEGLPDGVRTFAMPLAELAKKHHTLPVMKNTVALGAATRLLNLEFAPLEQMLRDLFGRKGEKVVTANVGAARDGYEYAGEHFEPLDRRVPLNDRRRLLLTGNMAVALGAVASGCKFFSQYPMTPASSIMHWIAEHASRYNVVLKQAEDELAAINMAIGANATGVRGMTATSGGGFALMTEALGLAGMIECPLVVVESQRGGPSTGMPTKTEQGDLFQILGASQGEFPRAVFAPRNVEEAFYIMPRAFNVADRYQMPVIVAMDFYLSEHYETLDDLDLEVEIDRGELVEEPSGDGPFARYRITDSGVSPRALPGTKGLAFVAGSDEHDEYGNLISDVLAGIPEYVEVRRRMHEKRMRKLDVLRREMRGPELWGPEDADITLVSWGSTQGAVREAIAAINGDDHGFRANSLEFTDLWPLPADRVAAALGRCRRTLGIECNYTGQLGKLIRMETGIGLDRHFGKYDGEPLTPSEVVAAVQEVMG